MNNQNGTHMDGRSSWAGVDGPFESNDLSQSPPEEVSDAEFDASDNVNTDSMRFSGDLTYMSLDASHGPLTGLDFNLTEQVVPTNPTHLPQYLPANLDHMNHSQLETDPTAGLSMLHQQQPAPSRGTKRSRDFGSPHRGPCPSFHTLQPHLSADNHNNDNMDVAHGHQQREYTYPTSNQEAVPSYNQPQPQRSQASTGPTASRSANSPRKQGKAPAQAQSFRYLEQMPPPSQRKVSGGTPRGLPYDQAQPYHFPAPVNANATGNARGRLHQRASSQGQQPDHTDRSFAEPSTRSSKRRSLVSTAMSQAEADFSIEDVEVLCFPRAKVSLQLLDSGERNTFVDSNVVVLRILNGKKARIIVEQR